MRIMFFALLFFLCSFHVFAQFPTEHDLKDKLNKIIKEIETLENKRDNLKGGTITWEYPFGIPQKQIEGAKKEIEENIAKLEKEKQRLEQRIRNITYRIKRIWIKDEGSSVDGTPWNAPDIYLKINGRQICEVQMDDWFFELTAAGIVAECVDLITFKKTESITIEVWDRDIKYDNRLFNIEINGNKAEKVESGNREKMSYHVEWEEI